MQTLSEPSTLVQHGFARYDLAEEFGITESDEAFRSLRAEFLDLPPDPYAPEVGRNRRYARGVFLPWSREFDWIPDTHLGERGRMNGYYQADHNPEYVGVVRELPAMSETARNNPIIREILSFDFAQTRWSRDDAAFPLHVGVHLIKLAVDDPRHEAISSPNELHQDGEPFVFAHLVYRRNVVGGVNVIAPPKYRGKLPSDVPDGEALAEFELTRPLESYGVTDEKVSHYVSPIRRGTAAETGERAVVLVDFTPMRQHI
ncbi:2OG-Fe dioxygenase family protein [Streptomyces sudanensis]|uniref:2OG-Fe dioxygenase family protein n=1 Tax=Streptomyces sudanensis TaxID=436397 RepID=UPI0020CBDC88|nr:2OG-Fe dioxygenase family protein [Streptomyces sudanensis]MCP9985360.1 2OG-Fe dioxygenase family protein [Streptomyces sudanensis]